MRAWEPVGEAKEGCCNSCLLLACLFDQPACPLLLQHSALTNPLPSVSHPPPPCRALLLGGDFFLGAVIAATLTKLVLRLRELRALPPTSLNRLSADVMACIAAMMRLGESGAAAAAGVHPIDADSRDRMAVCLRTLAAADSDAPLVRVWLEECRDAFAALISDKQQREAAEAKHEVGGLGGGLRSGWALLPQVLPGAQNVTPCSLLCMLALRDSLRDSLRGSLRGSLRDYASRCTPLLLLLTRLCCPSPASPPALPYPALQSRRPRLWRSPTS